MTFTGFLVIIVDGIKERDVKRNGMVMTKKKEYIWFRILFQFLTQYTVVFGRLFLFKIL